MFALSRIRYVYKCHGFVKSDGKTVCLQGFIRDTASLGLNLTFDLHCCPNLLPQVLQPSLQVGKLLTKLFSLFHNAWAFHCDAFELFVGVHCDYLWREDVGQIAQEMALDDLLADIVYEGF
ncbi:hypothetical protein B0A55_12801 [Friedmanniomyces simplex]|uniref:Uncharacterized protein n=1 Tax=Friedmanniomyces simplex TaxID=329884 RepID=A0A4U0WUZ2_9PEZI|nr:hypothetical protein B0A55_12801 [Friedmanniomyces simplex]